MFEPHRVPELCGAAHTPDIQLIYNIGTHRMNEIYEILRIYKIFRIAGDQDGSHQEFHMSVILQAKYIID